MTFASTVIALAPSAYYRCQEASGTSITDYSGNSNTGAVSGTVTFGQLALVNDGQTAKSIRAGTNPTRGYITAPTTMPGASNAAFTIGYFWNPTQTAIAYISGSGDDVSTSGWNIAMDGTYVYLSINQNGFSNTLYNARATYAAAGIAVGVEQLWWITYDGTGTWNVYINGSNTPLMTATGVAMVTPTTKQLAIGGYATQNQSCGGYFSELMYFSSVVSPASRASVYQAAQLPLVVPVLSTVCSTTGVVSSWTAASGGTAPYSYQLYRGLQPSLTFPASGQTLMYSGSGLTYSGVPPDTQLYYYNVVATDSSSPASTGQSNSVAGNITKNVLIGCIGDSRTLGYNPTAGAVSAPTQLPAILQPMLFNKAITVNNQGIGGTTTTSWLASNTLALALASIALSAASFTSGDKVYVQVNLGVNDGQVAYRVTAAQYKINLQAIIAAIKAYAIPQFAGIVLHYSFAPNIGVIAGYDVTCQQLVVAYNAVMLSLVDNVTVFMGDTTAFQYFGWNPALLTDGLHPYTPGYGAWAALWANAYSRILNPSSSTGKAAYATSVFAGTNYIVDKTTYFPGPTGTVTVNKGQVISNAAQAQLLLAAGIPLLPHP